MRRVSSFATIFLIAVSACRLPAQVPANGVSHDIAWYTSNAPFKMAAVAEPVIPSKTYSLKDFGGVADGKTLNTGAFAKAIEQCSKGGGGHVVVPAGKWLTGPIELKSNVDLHVEEGAVVQFSSDHAQFPLRDNGKNKYDVTPPIWGTKLENVSITGKGIFDGAGETWRPLKKVKVTEEHWNRVVKSGGVLSADGKIWWPSREAMNGEAYLKGLSKKETVSEQDYLPARDYLRPKMVVISNSKNVLLDGPTFRNSPNFIINPQRITNLIIRNVNVHNDGWAQNGDGIDISACNGVVIYRTVVNAGDDGICMKSSGSTPGNDGLQNVLIAECKVYEGHGAFVIGSNTDGGMKNIYVTNCQFEGTDIGIRVKSNTGRGGLVRDIFIDNILMKNILREAILFDTYYEDVPAGKERPASRISGNNDKIPEFTGFSIKDVTCLGAKTAMYFRGLPQMPVHDITFENVQIKSAKGVKAECVKNIKFKNVKLNTGDSPAIDPAQQSNFIIL